MKMKQSQWTGARVVALVAVAGLFASFGIAPAASSQDSDGAPRKHQVGAKRGFFEGMGRAIHGEFTVTKSDGSFGNMLMQVGEVTSVTPSRIVVRSVDDYSGSYAITEKTRVRSERNQLEDVKVGDQIRILASAEEKPARAVRIWKKPIRSRDRSRQAPLSERRST